jgi:hypothetical protein
MIMRKIQVWKKWEKVCFSFGVVYFSVMLALNVFIPNPTPTQYEIFKVGLALAAAGIGSILPGFIYIEGKFNKIALRASGALAFFLVVYFSTPTAPITPAKTQQTINGDHGTQINENRGIINIDHKASDTVKVKK